MTAPFTPGTHGGIDAIHFKRILLSPCLDLTDGTLIVQMDFVVESTTQVFVPAGALFEESIDERAEWCLRTLEPSGLPIMLDRSRISYLTTAYVREVLGARDVAYARRARTEHDLRAHVMLPWR